jgi:rare lipoprotein A (peptidoglycan hydrolase)
MCYNKQKRYHAMKIKKPTKLKTKSLSKPKLRGKAAKIAYLKRSAAAKSVHHRRRVKEHAQLHVLAALTTLLFVAGVGVALAAQVSDLMPPSNNSAQVDAYIRAAQAATQAKRAQQTAAQAQAEDPAQIGAASWYAAGLAAPDALTCASRTFPRGTRLRVHDLRNGHEVICLVNDYGPVAGTGRVIDLSRGSYSALEGLGSGTMPVEIWVVQ